MRCFRIAITIGLSWALVGSADARSERGFHLLPQPYVIASPAFSGAAAGSAPTPAGTDSSSIPADEQPTGVRTSPKPPAWAGAPAFATTIQAMNTPWVRVRFSDYRLGPGSYLLITSMLDGQVQRLDAASLPIWRNTSAIFNGDSVQVELFVAPDDRDAFFAVDQLLAADPEDFAGDAPAIPTPIIELTLCDGNDDRALSSDPRVGRLFFGGCTGWLGHNGAALTAGHCGTPDGAIAGVIEFNVPLSSPGGVPFAGPIVDQYPVIDVIASQSGGEGADYAVFSVGPNSNTGLRPHIAQGFFHMTSAVPVEGSGLRVTGYGVDYTPTGPGGVGAACCDIDDDDICDFACNSRNLVQQTDTGSCDDCLVGTAIEHTVDTMPANSGSPVIWSSPDAAIAIHTNGGCDTIFSDFDNAGTWLGYTPLRNALQNFVPNRIWADAASVHPVRTGTVLQAFRTLNEVALSAPTGSTVAVIAGDYPAAAGNVVTINRAMTLTAPMGFVRIGN